MYLGMKLPRSSSYDPGKKLLTRVRIQKPVVTYDPGKFSVTSSAGSPNFFLNIFILQF
jgi:hypothetical protein